MGAGDILYVSGQKAEAERLQTMDATFWLLVNRGQETLGDDPPIVEGGIFTASYFVHTDVAAYYIQMHGPEDGPQIIQLNRRWKVGTPPAYVLFEWCIVR